MKLKKRNIKLLAAKQLSQVHGGCNSNVPPPHMHASPIITEPPQHQ